MGKAEYSVSELVTMIEKGRLRLPEMQRRYVWRATRVRDLLDSLYRGYPSGAILVWETDGGTPEREFAIAQSNNPHSSGMLLLDGQQRLTSLSAVIRGEAVRVRGRKRPIDILFNLDHPEHTSLATDIDEEADDERDDSSADASEDDLQQRLEELTFVVATKSLAARPNWVSVTDAFRHTDNTRFLMRAGVTDLTDPRCERYTKRLDRLRSIMDYAYRVDILDKSMTYEEVTEIFVRVNSLGAKLRSSDLALAQITAKWPDSLRIFEEFQKQCAKTGFEVDLGVILRAIVAEATGQSRFKIVRNLPIQRIEESWAPATEGLLYAMDFCSTNAKINHPVLLSSPFLLITIGALGTAHGQTLADAEASLLRSWLLVANAKGRYSRGSSETILDQDLTTIRNRGGVRGLMDRVERAFGRLDVRPSDLAGRNQRSALFKTMFLAFREAGAKDWEQSVEISLSHRGKTQKIQFHHVFPRAVLRDHYKPAEVNDICNLAFIGGRTNRRISKKPPADYLAGILDQHGPAPLEAQCIPTDPVLYGIDRYPEFLEARRTLVADRLNEFLLGGVVSM